MHVPFFGSIEFKSFKGETQRKLFTITIYAISVVAKYLRMNQVKFVEDSL